MSTKPLDEVLSAVLAGVQLWRDKNTPESIQAAVIKDLDNSRHRIVLKLLGFDSDTWSKQEVWNLDHCNGRAGESAAGKYLREVQAEAIKEWLGKVELPKLPASAIKSLQNEAVSHYKDYLRGALREQALAKAQQDAKAIVNAVCTSDNLEKIQKMLQLIGDDTASAPHTIETKPT